MNISEYFFKKYVNQWHPAIDAILKDETKYSCALLLSAYTEMMGGLVSGRLLEKGVNKSNFNSFLEYMGTSYVDINRNHNNTVYDRMRNGLFHELEPKYHYEILVSNIEDKNKIGIEFNASLDVMRINLREYYRDFKKGVEKFHDEVQGPHIKVKKAENLSKCLRPYKTFPAQGGEIVTGFNGITHETEFDNN